MRFAELQVYSITEAAVDCHMANASKGTAPQDRVKEREREIKGDGELPAYGNGI